MEAKNYRGGAPKKKESESRIKLVRVLLNESEYSRLIERKSTTKSPNLSTFIRTVCLDRPMRMKPQLSTHLENVLSLLREMRADILRIGININQSSKRINSTTDYHNLQREVASMAGQVTRFDQQLDSLMNRFGRDDLPTESVDGSTN
jgi:hypothetical protein